MNAIMEYIKNCKNPFTEEDEGSDVDHLYNICSGKAASKETTDFLLNVRENGNDARNQFIERCIEDPASFEKPIKKQKIFSFSSEGVKTKRIRGDGKIQEVKMERDLMGRILAIALENKVDIKQVLEYPLTPVPLSLCHIDGLMNKTPKATLFQKLETRFKTVPPSWIDVYMVDGFFFLHLCLDLPMQYGKMARHILEKLCRSKAKRIDLVFDRIITPSIKDAERDLRSHSERDLPIKISGPNQQRPSDLFRALRNDCFKQELVKFLIEAFEDDSLSHIIGDKKIFVTCGTSCYSFTATEGKVLKKMEDSLFSTHEEADTRIIGHLKSITTPANVVIRTSDTDVFIIAIGNMSKIHSEVTTYLEVGLVSKNTLRYINFSAISAKLGPQLSNALPGFHAFTGCDYCPAFARKGKIAPLKILENNVSFQRAFSYFGGTEKLPEWVMEEIETFVCHMYGKKKLISVDDARLDAFDKVYKPKKRAIKVCKRYRF